MNASPPTDRTGPTTLDDALRAALHTHPPGLQTDAHFERVLLRLPNSPAADHSTRSTRTRRPWKAWLDALLSFGLGVATTVALVWVVTPAVNFEHPNAVEPLGHTAASNQLLLRVRVHDELPMGVWQQTLRELQANVVDGPGALGLWTLQVPLEQRERALHRLAHHPGVVEVVP